MGSQPKAQLPNSVQCGVLGFLGIFHRKQQFEINAAQGKHGPATQTTTIIAEDAEPNPICRIFASLSFGIGGFS
jgi:hypothetical protein